MKIHQVLFGRRDRLSLLNLEGLGDRGILHATPWLRRSQLSFSRGSFSTKLLLLLALLSPMAGRAQVDQGAITGSVSDSSGAVLPKANVTLTAIDTGLAIQTKSNQSGN